MTTRLSRRRFIGSVALLAGGLVVERAADAASPPKESGLSSEGLLVGHPGFQPRSIMPLPYEELPGFLSREQLARHHDDYVHLVEQLKATEIALHADGAKDGPYAELRRTQVATANGVLLHELYFGGLSPAKVSPPHYIDGHMNEHMGSFESWRVDFTQCSLAAKAWAVLVYDPYDDRWHNVVMDSENDGVWIGANPLVVCDVAAHAFSGAYQRREDYLAAFFDHIDWAEVAKRYRSVDRM